MLIEQIARTLRTLRVGLAFGLAASELRTIGLCLSCRLLALAALFETFEIDHFPHNHPS